MGGCGASEQRHRDAHVLPRLLQGRQRLVHLCGVCRGESKNKIRRIMHKPEGGMRCLWDRVRDRKAHDRPGRCSGTVAIWRGTCMARRWAGPAPQAGADGRMPHLIEEGLQHRLRGGPIASRAGCAGRGVCAVPTATRPETCSVVRRDADGAVRRDSREPSGERRPHGHGRPAHGIIIYMF